MSVVTGIQHVSLQVSDLERARVSYTGVLGLQPHPDKTNWLGLGQGCPVHLMEAMVEGEEPRDPACHVSFEVERLEEVVLLLLDGGMAPFQSDVTQREHRPVATADDPLTFGIGTVFVRDVDGNLVEFVERRRASSQPTIPTILQLRPPKAPHRGAIADEPERRQAR